jgi:hypothetical protein
VKKVRPAPVTMIERTEPERHSQRIRAISAAPMIKPKAFRPNGRAADIANITPPSAGPTRSRPACSTIASARLAFSRAAPANTWGSSDWAALS